jgi:hypothetical protein
MPALASDRARRVTSRCRIVRALLPLALAGCGAGAAVADPVAPTPPPTTTPLGPTAPIVPGQVYRDAQGWVEYTAGDAPIVIIAPHGGLLTPSALRDRSCDACVTTNDTNTQQLARAIVDSFTARTGRRPHLVVNLLHRRKFDANRDLPEATSGNAGALEPSWRWMHAAIDTARADVVRRWQHGLVIDLHGHAHTVPRLELGYLLTAAQLRLTDAELVAGALLDGSSVARLTRAPRSGLGAAAVLRGAGSLGALLEARGVPSVPSPSAPAPSVGEAYFSGGYNTFTHGSRDGGPVDAVQVECHFPGLRDTPGNRAQFASRFTDALIEFAIREYGFTP